jgi:Bacterial extracellular solute-binding proteins, family 5 Middle
MRPGISFDDGTPLTSHDVAFSLKILKDKGHPIAQQLLGDLIGAETTDDATVVVRFAAHHARDVPLFVASLPIFSRSYYSKRPFEETTLEAPLGSGPYKVGRFEPGRHIEYEQVKDWWGAGLPVARGQNKFREEFTSRTWATRYDFPAVHNGRVKRDVISDDTPSSLSVSPTGCARLHTLGANCSSISSGVGRRLAPSSRSPMVRSDSGKRSKRYGRRPAASAAGCTKPPTLASFCQKYEPELRFRRLCLPACCS